MELFDDGLTCGDQNIFRAQPQPYRQQRQELLLQPLRSHPLSEIVRRHGLELASELPHQLQRSMCA